MNEHQRLSPMSENIKKIWWTLEYFGNSSLVEHANSLVCVSQGCIPTLNLEEPTLRYVGVVPSGSTSVMCCVCPWRVVFHWNFLLFMALGIQAIGAVVSSSIPAELHHKILWCSHVQSWLQSEPRWQSFPSENGVVALLVGLYVSKLGGEAPADTIILKHGNVNMPNSTVRMCLVCVL